MSRTSRFQEEGPGYPVTQSIRVDKVSPRARFTKNVRAVIVFVVAIFLLIPVFVMFLTAFKTRPDIVSVPPKIT